MRRWNGWGDDQINYPVNGSATALLNRLVGESKPIQETSLQDILKRIPESRLPKHHLIKTEPLTRLLHARGQSFKNLIELHHGIISSFPDGVAYPMTNEEVSELLRYSSQVGAFVVPYGGGTSVVGHIDTIKSKHPVLTIDMSRMNRLLDLNADSMLATFGAGITGPDLEAQLRAHWFTLGHFPQSFEYSTLGGWISTRSSGQQSLGYGRIEKLFAGGHIETPSGDLDIPPFPASAAGPDLREMVLGSEGRLGVITEACVRIRPIPEHEEFHAVFFPDFQHGMRAVQEILAQGITVCMLRLSTASETMTTLAMAGHEHLIGTLERLLAIRGLGATKCMLLLGFNGNPGLMHTNRGEALSITSKFRGTHVGRTFGDQWHKNRFFTPYLRNALWDLGYGVDTLETATDWSKVASLIDQIENAIKESMRDRGEKVHVFTHLSHVYPYGSSIYVTTIFRLDRDAGKTLSRWQAMKSAASKAIIDGGGTISHHHGVGTDHLQYLSTEKGTLGIKAISAVCHQFDPKGIMNPGKLTAT